MMGAMGLNVINPASLPQISGLQDLIALVEFFSNEQKYLPILHELRDAVKNANEKTEQANHAIRAARAELAVIEAKYEAIVRKSVETENETAAYLQALKDREAACEARAEEIARKIGEADQAKAEHEKARDDLRRQLRALSDQLSTEKA